MVTGGGGPQTKSMTTPTKSNANPSAVNTMLPSDAEVLFAPRGILQSSNPKQKFKRHLIVVRRLVVLAHMAGVLEPLEGGVGQQGF